jgi:hypothetical protein
MNTKTSSLSLTCLLSLVLLHCDAGETKVADPTGSAGQAQGGEAGQGGSEQGGEGGSGGGGGSDAGGAGTGGSAQGGTSGQGGSGAGGSGNTPTCGMETKIATCDACLDKSCCSQETACANNSQCYPLYECVSKCSSPTCKTNCKTQFSSALNVYNDLNDCYDNNCKLACGTGGSGGSSGGGGSFVTGGSGGTGGQGGGGAGGTTNGCNVPSTPPSGGACVAGKFTCNPVTNQGCSTGYSCDFVSNENVFDCLPSGVVPVCGNCNNNTGTYCKGGLACNVGGKCVKVCCDSNDCGGSICDKSVIPGSASGLLGLCILSGSGGTSG